MIVSVFSIPLIFSFAWEHLLAIEFANFTSLPRQSISTHSPKFAGL